MEFALFALLMIGCIFAVIEITRALMQYILLTKKTPNTITVMPISGRIDDVEYIVRGLMWKKNWTDDNIPEKIILLDLGADDETVSICKSLAEDNELIEFYSPQELENYLKK